MSMISIVILTKNAGYKFEQTLTAICGQDIDKPYEIIVVDSGSTDDTLNILNKFCVKIYKIMPEDFNFGLTRDYAFSLASGDYIVTISQDVIPCDSMWLKNLVTPFYDNDKAMAVQGMPKIPENEDIFYWVKNGYFYFTSESKNWVEKYNGSLSFVNCAIRKEFWEKNQICFALHSEDKLFQKRIYDSGYVVVYARDAVCFHGHQYSFKSLIKRLINEGVGCQHIGVSYGLIDCLRDIYKNKFLIRKSINALLNREIKTIHEFIFPVLRPICIYRGNKKKI